MKGTAEQNFQDHQERDLAGSGGCIRPGSISFHQDMETSGGSVMFIIAGPPAIKFIPFEVQVFRQCLCDLAPAGIKGADKSCLFIFHK